MNKIHDIKVYGERVKQFDLDPFTTIKRYEYEGKHYIIIMFHGNDIAVYEVSNIIKEGEED